MDGKYKTNKFVKTTMHCLFTQCSLMLMLDQLYVFCHLKLNMMMSLLHFRILSKGKTLEGRVLGVYIVC